MSIAGGPVITIMRPGSFTAMNGQTVPFSRADLAGVAASYDPKSDPAPLVVGHPQIDHPAYGWVKSVELDGDNLVVRPEKVMPEFAEAVRGGRYSKVSASFYPPDNPNNPKPGSYYLKHVGFLGAAAPAVKGLGTVQFGEDIDALVTVATSQHVERPSVITRFTAPCGRTMECEARQLASMTRIVQMEYPHLSFADATEVACIEVALDNQVMCFGAPVSSAVEGQVRVLYQMKRLRLIDPALSFVEAYREVTNVTTGGFATPAGWSVTPKDVALYKEAKALQRKKPGLGIIEAAAQIKDRHRRGI